MIEVAVLFPENEWLKAEIMHHGIKGMKWGVRRTPEELGHPRKSLDKSGGNGKLNTSVVNAAIRSGKVSKKVNADKQSRHSLGHKNYVEGRSYLHDGSIANAQKLVDELSGTGKAILDRNGKWVQMEHVSASKIIGTSVNSDTGRKTQTKKAAIKYSKTGSHIYPRGR